MCPLPLPLLLAPPPSRGGLFPLPRVRPSLSARTHALHIFYNRKKRERERERGTVSLRTHNAHARTQSLPAVGDLNVPHVRPFSFRNQSGVSHQLSPGKKKKQQQQPQQKRRPSGEVARQGGPHHRCRRRRHLVLLLRRPRRAVGQSLSFVATITAPAAATTCPCRRHWLAGRVLNSLVSGTPRWTS